MDQNVGTGFRNVHETVPEVPGDGILIKTIYAGLGQERKTENTGGKRTTLYSNEICGRVLTVGSKVSSDCSIKSGDVVIVYPWLGCGQCETCSSGSTYLCEEIGGGRDSIEEEGGQRNAFVLSRYLVVQEWQNLVKLPKEIAKDIGCMLPYWALKEYAAIVEAKPAFEQAVLIRGFANLLIIGSCSLELWCVALLKNVFCDRNVKVICTESNQDSLDLALRSGADDAIVWKEGASVEELVDATTMSGYNKMDVVVDLVGSATSFKVALLALHSGGTILELAEKAETVDLPIAQLVDRSVTVKAIRAGSRYLLKQLVDLIAIQRVSLDIPLESYSVDDLEVALGELRTGQVKGHAIVRYE